MSEKVATGYPVDEVNRVKRRPDRGFHDQATVHAVLDAAALCHVSYVVDGFPYCTPTLFWREDSRFHRHVDGCNRNMQIG
jgi:nitroimidazol reductase NimA-like FMN-containing flavoprotein (pyridoxamine 5'-phosphate oxidase superfamily)